MPAGCGRETSTWALAAERPFAVAVYVTGASGNRGG
jgi:hypothetical protein